MEQKKSELKTQEANIRIYGVLCALLVFLGAIFFVVSGWTHVIYLIPLILIDGFLVFKALRKKIEIEDWILENT